MAPLYGVYRGRCFNNADPENRGRIKVQVPQVCGEQVLENWAWPCRPPGWDSGLLQTHGGDHGHPHALVQAVPAPEQGVWVMFEGGDRDHPIWIGTF